MTSLAKVSRKDRSRKKKNADITNMVKQMISSANPVEYKYFDQYSAGSIPVAGVLTLISDVTRGDEVTQRIGNQITLRRLDFKLTANIHPNGSNAYVRAIIVLDKMGYNAPTIADIIDPLYLSSPYNAVGLYTWDYRKRFDILYDDKILLTLTSFSAGSLECHKKFKINSQHIGASTTFKNQLYLLILSTETNVLIYPGHYWTTRLQYTDD